MKSYMINGVVVTPTEMIEDGCITIENGQIADISPYLPSIQPGDKLFDAQGFYITPGLIDIHFHGAMGKDTMDADPLSLQAMSQFCLEHGVTSFYPTTWSAEAQDIFAAIQTVKQNINLTTGAQILGMHIEGPYLDIEYRGAQLPSLIREPDPDEYHRWFDSGIVKIITCAPEIPHGFEFVKAAVQHGIRISIGHTQASYEDVIKAADDGATQATHIFNGMLGLHHRKPGTVGGILAEKRIFAQIISDGVHLHPAVVDMVINAKSPNRCILITDSIRGAGLPDGDYEHKGQKFSVREGIARTPEGGLSGSTLTMDQAIRNALKFTGRPITEILPMATSVPAHEMGLTGLKGIIQPGADADLVLFDKNFQINQVFVKGECLYKQI